MVEMILYHEIKMPVGASSERLMSESLNCSFKRFVQTADSSDVYARTNETLTEPISSAKKCKWPNIIVFTHWTIY